MVKERRKLGIIFSYNDNWIGGSYYVLNLIAVLKVLPDSLKPHLVVFTDNEDSQKKVREIEYPYIQFLPVSFNFSWIERAVNKISRLLIRKDVIVKVHSADTCESVFPYAWEPALKEIRKKISWVPDLQQHFLPQFFTSKELTKRIKSLEKVVQNKLPIIFSSNDSLNGFRQIYPAAQNNTFVMNFTVTHPAFQHLSIEDLKLKYRITKPYIISPNQFWKHKNHMVVLEAGKALLKKNIDFQIVFTGKEYDFRNPEYTEELKRFVDENGLADHVKFLGFIDRKEQLQLMYYASAILQPSLFEGWSTVVEDAKAMSKFLIVSDLEVHKEQLKDYPNKLYFQPNDAKQLEISVENQLKYPVDILLFDYDFSKTNLAKTFLEIIDNSK